MSTTTNPYEDMPSAETEACDIGGCCEPWAWEADRRNGPRKLRLCEEHATRWQMAERDYLAEREEMRGRTPRAVEWSALFGLARAMDGHVANGRKGAA